MGHWHPAPALFLKSSLTIHKSRACLFPSYILPCTENFSRASVQEHQYQIYLHWGEEGILIAEETEDGKSRLKRVPTSMNLQTVTEQQQLLLFLPFVIGDSSSAAFLSCPQVPNQTSNHSYLVLGWVTAQASDTRLQL